MIKIITAQGTEFGANWVGVSDLDGSLRFELVESDMQTAFGVFSDREHTKELTRVFDDDKRVFEGYTMLIRLAQMPAGIVIGLMHDWSNPE